MNSATRTRFNVCQRAAPWTSVRLTPGEARLYLHEAVVYFRGAPRRLDPWVRGSTAGSPMPTRSWRPGLPPEPFLAPFSRIPSGTDDTNTAARGWRQREGDPGVVGHHLKRPQI
jgi:hypothetical protein